MEACKHESIVAALAAAQSEYPPIPRTKTVKVRTRTGGEYTFDYAPLEEIMAAIMPALNRHGIALTQSVSENRALVTTRMMHESGGVIESTYPVMSSDENPNSQEFGGNATYAFRRGFTAAVGCFTEDDDDANAAIGNQANVTRHSPPKRVATSPAITEEQLAILDKLIVDTGTDVGRFLRAYGASALAEFPAQSFAQAHEILRRKQAKQAAAVTHE